jgi:cytochrome c biogenesis protein CcmG/thiol:disulfide interchange protein DsbE
MMALRSSAAATLLACSLAGPALAVAPGAPAPAFTLDGRAAPVSLADYRGKFVYLDFWASWCAPCKRSFPWMAELQKRHGDKLQVVAVNVDTGRADAERFLAQTPAAFTVAFDPSGATPRLYSIKGMPSSVLIDPEGKVIVMHAGYNDATAQTIESQVRLAMEATKGAR